MGYQPPFSPSCEPEAATEGLVVDGLTPRLGIELPRKEGPESRAVCPPYVLSLRPFLSWEGFFKDQS